MDTLVILRVILRYLITYDSTSRESRGLGALGEMEMIYIGR